MSLKRTVNGWITKLNKNYRKSTTYFILALIILLSAILIFTNLGDRTLSHDEIDTAKFTMHLKSCGFPYNQPCTENTIFNPEDAPNLFPRLTYYISYLTFYLPGDFELNQRIPFAIIGILSIIAFFYFAKEMLKSEKHALFASFLYSFGIVFLLHTRSARYYTLIFLFGIMAYHGWYKFIKTDKPNFIGVFGLIMLFYSHIQIFFYVSASLFLFSLFKKRFKNTIIQGFGILLIIIPGIYLYFFKWDILGKGNMLHLFLKPADLLMSFGVILFYLFAFFIPIVFLLFFPKKTEERDYIIYLVISLSILMAIITHNSLPELRKYASIIYPIATIFIAMSLLNLKKISKIIFYLLTIIFILTNVIFIIPFLPLKIIPLTALPGAASSESGSSLDQSSMLCFVRESTNPRFIYYEFYYELTHHYESGIEMILKYKDLFQGKMVYSEISNDAMLVYMPKVITVGNISGADYLIVSTPNVPGYKTIGLLNLKYSQWEGAPDIVHHRFRQDTNGKMYVMQKIQ